MTDKHFISNTPIAGLIIFVGLILLGFSFSEYNNLQASSGGNLFVDTSTLNLHLIGSGFIVLSGLFYSNIIRKKLGINISEQHVKISVIVILIIGLYLAFSQPTTILYN